MEGCPTQLATQEVVCLAYRSRRHTFLERIVRRRRRRRLFRRRRCLQNERWRLVVYLFYHVYDFCTRKGPK